jgi:hypothetical protein
MTGHARRRFSVALSLNAKRGPGLHRNILANPYVNTRNAGVHSAVIRGRPPRVVVACDASKFRYVKAAPFRKGPRTTAAILECHDISAAVIATPDGVWAKVAKPPLIGRGKAALINNRLPDYIVGVHRVLPSRQDDV